MKNIEISCGIDEVGRGSLAGPLVVACVSFKSYEKIPLGIVDSKKTTSKQRQLLFKSIKKKAYISYSLISSRVIDRIGINQATCLGFDTVLKNNKNKIAIALLDGNIQPNLNIKFRNIIKGDRNYVSIAAASIIAKYIRDKFMKNLGKKFQNYGWNKNVGYGTIEHLNAIEKYGITKYHRKTYNPIKKYIN